MDAFWQTSTFFGIFITLFFYGVGMFLKQKVKHTLVNPLLIAIVFTILFLHLFGIDYKTYNNSAYLPGGTPVPAAGYTETKF